MLKMKGAGSLAVTRFAALRHTSTQEKSSEASNVRQRHPLLTSEARNTSRAPVLCMVMEPCHMLVVRRCL